MSLLVVVPSLVCVAAAAALAHALRGRKVDDHPICRKCGFDLFGKPAGSPVCSECGADVSRGAAIRVGRRERRRGLAAVSASALVLCLTCLGLVGRLGARGAHWNRHKPVWWLLREARGAEGLPRDVALVELTDRMLNGRLSSDQEAALLNAALDLQGDPSRAWTVSAGDVIVKARGAGKLADGQWERYATQAVPVEMVARAVVRQGDPPVFRLVVGPPRLGSGHSINLEYEILLTRVGETIDTGLRGAGDVHFLSAGDNAKPKTFIAPGADVLAGLPCGSHTLHASLRLELTCPPARPTGQPTGRPSAPIHTTREVSAPVTLVPANSVTVTIDDDPSLRPAVEGVMSARFTPASAGGHCALLVEADKPPVDLAYAAFARRGDREWKLGTAHFRAGQSGRAVNVQQLLTRVSDVNPGIHGEPPASARFDVLLRPSVEQAVRTVEMTRIWGGEILFRDVAVDREPAGGGGALRRMTDIGTPSFAPAAVRPATSRPS